MRHNLVPSHPPVGTPTGGLHARPGNSPMETLRAEISHARNHQSGDEAHLYFKASISNSLEKRPVSRKVVQLR